MLPTRACSTRRSALARGLVLSALPPSCSSNNTHLFFSSSSSSSYRKTASSRPEAPQSVALESRKQPSARHYFSSFPPHQNHKDILRSSSSDKAARRKNPLVPDTTKTPSPVPPQLFSEQQRKRKSGRMNFGSHNVRIPGLDLLNSGLPSSHLPPIAPLTAGGTGPSTAQGQASLWAASSTSTSTGTTTPTPTPSQSDSRHTPGGKKRKAALRRQAEASKQPSGFSSPDHKNGSKSRHFRKPTPSQEDRQTPSEESGGVPDPHPLYLAQSLAPPLLVPSPRRMLVIMDLNGTLLYRPNKRNPFHFIQRPHARAFMDYCLQTFHVAIWSSARPENVAKMVAQLLTPAQRARLVVIWARDRFGLSPADYDSRVQCYKRLSSLWADPAVAASHPLAADGHRWDQTNTVLVDDSVEKARSEPYNLLEIPEFSGVKHEMVDVLPQVHEYLNQCCYQADVSRFIRQNPFKLDLHHGAQY